MSAPTFNWKASFGSNKNSKFRVRKAQYGDGYAQRTGDGINNLEASWSLQFKARTTAEAQAVIAFLNERAGYKWFWWTPYLDSTPIKVVCESYDESPVEGDFLTVNMRFDRVYVNGVGQ